jgi:hypothetical protein
VAGDPVEARATVRQGTAPAPDGTVVTFTLPQRVCWNDANNNGQVDEGELVQCHVFQESGTVTLAKETVAGVASAIWTSRTNGEVQVSANVGSAHASATVTFRGPVPEILPASGPPRILRITPSVGRASGGETVTIEGENLCASYYVATKQCVQPATVVFDVGVPVNAKRNAEVLGNAATVNRLVVITPQISPTGLTADPLASVVVNNGAGSDTLTNGFLFLRQQTQVVPAAGPPKVYQVEPNVGSGNGGDTVSLIGENLCAYYTPGGQCAQPASVTFEIGAPVNATRSVAVVAASATGDRLVILTPKPSPNPLTADALASVVVDNGVGTYTHTNGFRYSAVQLPPLIFRVEPSFGSARGGEVVTIYGAHFQEPVKVTFSPGGVAEVVDVPPGGDRIVVKTPENSVPLDADTTADVTVTTLFGTGRDQTVTKTGAFVFKAEVTTPVLYALSPNAGPIEGGTRVTIFGAGFQYPVQVLFGDREAQVLSSNFNQIVCLAPSIAPSQPGTPTVVNVTVRNVLTGKVSSNFLQYRYGEAMFVSGISPNVGYILGWTPATIYGQGFVAPVQVVVTVGGIAKEAQVLSVSGTSIQVKMPPFPEAIGGTGCTPQPDTFTVTNLGSNLTAAGPPFTYLCSGGISGP